MKEKLYNLMNWAEIEGIVYSEEDRPGTILGPKAIGNSILVQAFFPNAKKVTLVLEEKQKKVIMDMADEEGFFAALINGKKLGRYFYEVEFEKGEKTVRRDPYVFSASLPQEEIDRFKAGTNYEIYKILGSHRKQEEGCDGVQFSVWVPGAVRVSVIGDFNNWNGRSMPMNRVGNSAVFTLFVPGLVGDEEYCYEVKVKNGSVYELKDPYAEERIIGEKSVSRLHRKENFLWEDDDWRKERRKKEAEAKMFDCNGQKLSGLQSFTGQLKQQGYHYVSLPCFYPKDSFYGLPDFLESETQLKIFTNEMHKAGIGVIFNWNVSECQELYKKQISNFYISNVLWWIEEFHMDGLIFSGMEKLLYLDYGKEPGQWTANAYGGNENLDGVEFIKHTNSILRSKKEGILLIADMDAIWPNVTKALEEDGLGFDYRLDTDFTKKLLEYLTADAEQRVYMPEKLMGRMEYAFEERFMMALGADKTPGLWKQLPGKEEEKLAVMKAAAAYVELLPGKLLWGFEVPGKKKKEYLEFVAACHDLKEKYEALRQKDQIPSNFRWLNCDREKEGVISFMYDSAEEEGSLLVVSNFTKKERAGFKIGVPYEGKYEAVFSSKETAANEKSRRQPGFTQENGFDGFLQSLELDLSSLSVNVYRYTPFTEEEIYQIAEERAEKIREQIMEEARIKAERLKKAKGKQ